MRPRLRPRLRPRVRLALLAIWIAVLATVVLASGSLSPHHLQRQLSGHGALGPLIFIAVSSLLTLALFPGPLLAAASGLLFGTALGTPLSIVAATVGALGAFTIARRVAGDAAARLAGPRLRAVNAWVEGHGFRAVLYARIAPGVPYTLVNYAAGLTPVAATSFAAATALGVAPRAFAYTALGGSISNLDSPEAIVAVGVLAAMALAGLTLGGLDTRRRRVRAVDKHGDLCKPPGSPFLPSKEEPPRP